MCVNNNLGLWGLIPPVPPGSALVNKCTDDVVCLMRQVGWTVDVSQFTDSFTQILSSMTFNSDMLCAVRCLRAEGIKTALLTNNFNLPNTSPLSALDPGLFDVVSVHHLTQVCLMWCVYITWPRLVWCGECTLLVWCDETVCLLFLTECYYVMFDYQSHFFIFCLSVCLRLLVCYCECVQVIESWRVKMRKPERRIYEYTLSALNVQPNEAVLLDDLGVNLRAAKELGMRTIKVLFHCRQPPTRLCVWFTMTRSVLL